MKPLAEYLVTQMMIRGSASSGSSTLLSIIQDLGLDTDLAVLLDMDDPNSYDNSSPTVFTNVAPDAISGNVLTFAISAGWDFTDNGSGNTLQPTDTSTDRRIICDQNPSWFRFLHQSANTVMHIIQPTAVVPAQAQFLNTNWRNSASEEGWGIWARTTNQVAYGGFDTGTSSITVQSTAGWVADSTWKSFVGKRPTGSGTQSLQMIHTELDTLVADNQAANLNMDLINNPQYNVHLWSAPLTNWSNTQPLCNAFIVWRRELTDQEVTDLNAAIQSRFY